MILFLACAAPVVASDDAPTTPRRVRYGFTLENTRGAMLPRADLWTYAPMQATSSQCRNLIRASHPYRLMEDDDGNTILHFSFENLPPFAVRVVSVDVDLATREEPGARPAPAPEHLEASALMPIDSTRFQHLATAFRPRPDDPVAEQAFAFVRRTVTDTGYDARDRGALHALEERSGDCTEFASLFGALCRAQGIPARLMGGYLCGGNGVLGARSYHNWAEFYRDGAWHVADCQKNVFGGSAAGYVAMQNVTDSAGPMRGYPRFRHEGEGLKVTMNGQ